MKTCTRVRASLAAALIGAPACAEMVTDLTDYGTIVVEARTLSGTPVPGARLTLYNGVRILSVASTGVDGRHVFEFVPPNEYGIFSGTPDGFVRPQYLTGGDLALIADGIVIEEGSRASVRFDYLKVGPGSIRARVIDTGGAPIAGALLTAYSQAAVRQLRSGPDGSALFENLPFANWGVGAEPPDPYGIPDGYSLATDGLLVEEGVMLDAELVMDLEALERCGGTVAVTATDALGNGVPGAPLLIYHQWGELAKGTTDETGAREFLDVPCRTVAASIGEIPGWELEPGAGVVEDLVVTQASRVEVAFALRQCAGPVRVTVLDESGTPVAGVELTLSSTTQVVATGITASNGSHDFGDLRCDVPHRVDLTVPPGYAAEGGSSARITVTSAAGLSHTFRIRRIS